MSLTIQQVIDTILAGMTKPPEPETVDGFKSGDPTQPVTGVATTFIATPDVIRKSAAAGANLIITHEPTYYTHIDQTDWLAENEQYHAKKALIEELGMTIWRFHDGWHRTQPDGILTGMVAQLGWQTYQDPDDPWIFNIPASTLLETARHFQTKLNASNLRYLGPEDLPCQRVAFLPGAIWEKWQINALSKADVLAVGEANEWSVAEFARDSQSLGKPKGLILIGHVSSEEGGMEYLGEWLQERIPGLPITHIPAGPPPIKKL